MGNKPHKNSTTNMYVEISVHFLCLRRPLSDRLSLQFKKFKNSKNKLTDECQTRARRIGILARQKADI